MAAVESASNQILNIQYNPSARYKETPCNYLTTAEQIRLYSTVVGFTTAFKREKEQHRRTLGRARPPCSRARLPCKKFFDKVQVLEESHGERRAAQ